MKIDGEVVERFFFDMSSRATPTVDQLGGSKLPDLIRLLDGNDRFTGGRGDDLIHGNRGDDWINGNQGDDQIEGGHGNDIAKGGKNIDTINLGAGDDWANGNKGDDLIHGGIGDDYLTGGKGDDVLWGGDGADRFAMSRGIDVVKDFDSSEGDKVVIPPGTTISLTKQNGNALLQTQTGSFLFEGINMGDFDLDRFVTST